MNILFSVPRLHTNYAAMIQGLIEDGHKVSFIAMDAGSVTIPSDYSVPVYHFRARKRWYTPRHREKQLHYESFRKLNSVLKSEKPDLIITRDLQLNHMQLSLLGKLKGIPTLYYDQVPPTVNKSLKKKLWYFTVHTFISKYRMTTVKKDDKDIGTSKNVFFIPFAVPSTPLKQYYPDRISIESPLKIIVVSKLGEKRKNLLFLLRSLLPFFEKKIIHISIYGFLRDNPVSKKNFKDLTDFIAKHELGNLVAIHKNKTHKEVLNTYSEHDLFILPSLDEPAAISPFEAMSSGLPVIVTNQNGTNYIIDEGENGFTFSPENKLELQEYLNMLIKNSNLLKTIGKEAFNTVNNNYRPKHFSDNIMNFYDSVNDISLL